MFQVSFQLVVNCGYCCKIILYFEGHKVVKKKKKTLELDPTIFMSL